MKFSAFLSLTLLLTQVGFSQAETVHTQIGLLTLNANLVQVENWPAGTTLLITHGTLSHYDSELIQTLQTLFEEQGVSSLAINLSLGIDHRLGSYDCKVAHRHTQEDAPTEMAVWQKWLTTKGVSDIVPLGHSRGGNQTARFVASQTGPTISRAILVAPALLEKQNPPDETHKEKNQDLSTFLTQAHSLINAGKPDALLSTDFLYCPEAKVTARSLLSYYDVDPQLGTRSLLQKIHIPVLVIAGSEDTTVPGIEQALSSTKKSDSIKVVTIDGADHFFRDLYADDLVELAVEFLARTRKSPGK